MEETKIKTYEYPKTREPINIKIGENTLSVQHSKSKRILDGKVFEDVQIVRFVKGRNGDTVPKYNGRLNMPIGLTADIWKQLERAYIEMSKDLGKA